MTSEQFMNKLTKFLHENAEYNWCINRQDHQDGGICLSGLTVWGLEPEKAKT